MHKILQVCRHTITTESDYHKAINNAFPPDHYAVTTIFLHGILSPEQIDAYYGKIFFWQLENAFFKQKILIPKKLGFSFLEKS